MASEYPTKRSVGVDFELILHHIIVHSCMSMYGYNQISRRDLKVSSVQSSVAANHAREAQTLQALAVRDTQAAP